MPIDDQPEATHDAAGAVGDPVWSGLLKSIRRHRSPGARFYKPVCLIGAIDLMDEGLMDPEAVDAGAVIDRFHAYVGVRDPDRANQGWRPLWHLTNDGVWTFRSGERTVTPDMFGPERSPRSRSHLSSVVDGLSIADRLRPAWRDPASLLSLRRDLLRILAEEEGDSRRYSRQLFVPTKFDRPEAWPSQAEVDLELDVSREQLDFFGAGTGLEADDSPSPESSDIKVPFDPDEVDVVTRQMTVDLLLSRVRRGMVDLQADFQRRWGIWDDGRQSRLIESLLLRIPLPVIYAAEDRDERWEIVDGIQRLSTIARFVDPEPIGARPLALVGLNSLRDYNGKTFEDLSERLKVRLREAELVVHLIRKGTPAKVKFNVFARINTGGVALSAQELRHAITPGPCRGILEDLANSQEFLDATDGSVRTSRMADRELVLRFLAFYLKGVESYDRPDMDAFLLDAMALLNELGPREVAETRRAFAASMASAREIFGDDAFRKRTSPSAGRRPINKALFEALSVALAARDQASLALLRKRREAVAADFMRLCADRAFEAAVTQGTGDVAKVRRRFSDVSGLLEAQADT